MSSLLPLTYMDGSFTYAERANVRWRLNCQPSKNANGLATSLKEIFRAIAHATAKKTGFASAFLIAMLCVIGWLITGPYFRYSGSWQLVINTGTTIVTFLMVFRTPRIVTRERSTRSWTN
jgi:hypothetical protein